MIQKEYEKTILNLIPIKNIQISHIGCYIVVFKTTPQETINLLKRKGFKGFKSGVFHTLKKEDMYIQITNRRNRFYAEHISKDTLKELNLLDKYLINGVKNE